MKDYKNASKEQLYYKSTTQLKLINDTMEKWEDITRESARYKLHNLKILSHTYTVGILDESNLNMQVVRLSCSARDKSKISVIF